MIAGLFRVRSGLVAPVGFGGVVRSLGEGEFSCLGPDVEESAGCRGGDVDDAGRLIPRLRAGPHDLPARPETHKESSCTRTQTGNWTCRTRPLSTTHTQVPSVSTTTKAYAPRGRVSCMAEPSRAWRIGGCFLPFLHRLLGTGGDAMSIDPRAMTPVPSICRGECYDPVARATPECLETGGAGRGGIIREDPRRAAFATELLAPLSNPLGGGSAGVASRRRPLCPSLSINVSGDSRRWASWTPRERSAL